MINVRNRLFAVVLALGIFIPAAVYANEISVAIDGVRVEFADQHPAIVDNRTLVPVRGVFEHLGFYVVWDDETQSAILTRTGFEVIITLESDVFTTNGVSHSLDVPAQLINNRTMLPIRAVLESVGYYVGWDYAAQTVLVSAEPIPEQAAPAPVEPEPAPAAQEDFLTAIRPWQNVITDAYITPHVITADGSVWTWGGFDVTYELATPRRLPEFDDAVSLSITEARIPYVIRSDGSLWGGPGSWPERQWQQLMTDVLAVNGCRGTWVLRTDRSVWYVGSESELVAASPDGSPWFVYNESMGFYEYIGSERWEWDNPIMIRDSAGVIVKDGIDERHLAWFDNPNEWHALLGGGGGRRATNGNLITLSSNDPQWQAIIESERGIEKMMAEHQGRAPIEAVAEDWVLDDVVFLFRGAEFTHSGGRHWLALRADGSLYSMGNNHRGQLGIGTTEPFRLTPTRIMDNVMLPN